MRVLSWNILQGGGKRAFDISDAITEFKPDIAVLQEFRNGNSASPILDACKSLGLTNTHVTKSEPRKNTVMIASKFPMQIGTWEPSLDADLAVEASIDLDTDDNNANQLRLLVGHLPQKKAQVPYLDALYKMQLEADDHIMIIGDLNVGIPFEDSDTKSFVNTHMFQALLSKGWIDSWRSRNSDVKEFTWVSSARGNGYRYDHALCNKLLDNRIEKIQYDHSVRESKLSDHSALLVDFKLSA